MKTRYKKLVRRIYNKLVRRIKKNYISLTNKKEIVYKTRFGFKILLDLSKEVDRNIYLNDFENNTIDFFKKSLKKGMTVFDIGANIGIYSLIASNKIKKEGKVFSFEPSDWAYKRLLHNIKFSKYSNIIINNTGIADNTGELKFYVCEDDAYNSIGNTPMKNIIGVNTINVFSLDDYVSMNNIKKVDIIKVDTEGAEFLVFKGAEKTLKKHAPIIFFEYNPHAVKGFNYSSLDAINLIKSHGYRCYEFVENELVEIKDNIIKSFDIIASKDKQTSSNI
jgi:FkbM family methyltransferase